MSFVENSASDGALHKNEQIIRWRIPQTYVLVSTIGTSIDFFDPEKVVWDAHFRHLGPIFHTWGIQGIIEGIQTTVWGGFDLRFFVFVAEILADGEFIHPETTSIKHLTFP